MLLAGGGYTDPKVAQRLGMTPAMFNERYSHLLPDIQRDAADLIDTKMKMSKKPEDQTTP